MTAAEILRARADAYTAHAGTTPHPADYEWIASELRRVAGVVVVSDEWHERWAVAA